VKRGQLAVLAAAGGAAALLLMLARGGSSDAPPSPPTAHPTTAHRAQRSPAPLRARVERALSHATAAAASLGGTVEAAAMVDDWRRPVVAGGERLAGERQMRMWSMSKVATMVALLRGLGWGERPGQPISPELEEALDGALRRSENCHQRRVVLELERIYGGAGPTRAALAEVFAIAGADPDIGAEVEAPEPVCLPYLESQREIADPLAPALLLGISTWDVEDAVLLMRALAVDAYGAAVSGRVLGLLREPKLPSREVPPGELTAPLGWGAGKAFAGLAPAYKAGWGGVMHGNFLAGQIALVRLRDGSQLAFAAMFHPNVEPPRDDPGVTPAPRAIELVMRTLRAAVE
jgi:hypothetical protein